MEATHLNTDFESEDGRERVIKLLEDLRSVLQVVGKWRVEEWCVDGWCVDEWCVDGRCVDE